MKNAMLKEAESKMEKSVEKIVEEFSHMRTGRPSPSLLEEIKVDYYGVPTPVNQLATINVSEDRSLIVKPWEKNMLSLIEKAILASNLGLTPLNDGNVIRLNFPIPTTEQREKWIKLAKEIAEKGKVAIRNIRRDFIKEAKELQKEGEMTEDDLKRFEEEIQKLTNKYVDEMDNQLEKKKKEIMEF
ncbi:ribosome recycling factor [Kosmotoga arenicorallina S304]|uniref:Ribosome-recycling factor n=1 Tax=Kosmotoga arenicorallina S304 TaxID=1453497 RepID=A0A182C739_9BACT|nr:ribosome recycling factor [Kosmotoga arenicorallina]OAA31254.1 ribosome recycling factor [Kosmotoga arenicorallina S304]